MILPPRQRSWSRAKMLTSSVRHRSFLRAFEAEYLAELEIKGEALDIGGGRKAQYRDLLANYDRLDSLNIDANLEPTILANANEQFPIADERYDTIISCNTLEHLINDVHVVHETMRVLRPGGRAHIFVPFLFPVHGSPQDFHRHTALYWEQLLESLDAAQIVIQPLVWNAEVSALATLGHVRWAKWLARAIVLVTGLRNGDGLDAGAGNAKEVARAANFAMGYLLQFSKQTF